MQITAVCVVSTLLVLVLKRGTPEHGLLLTLAVVALVLLFLEDTIRELLAFIETLAGKSGIAEELFVPLYKTVGIAMVVKIGAGLCRDAGETALASTVETAGILCALLVALPLLQTVLSLLLELMQ